MKYPVGVIIASLLAFGASFASASASEITLCAGKEGGGYDGVMRAVSVELEKLGNTVTILNLDGSEAILDALEAGRCAYGPAQKDVDYLKAKNDPGFEASVRPVSVLYNEVMTMVCSAESGIDELSDLTSDNTVIVDTIGSGSALSWDNMVQIEKEFGGGSSWSAATPKYLPLSEAEAAISVGEAQCAFGIAGVPAGWALTFINDGGTLAWVYDKDLNDLEFPKGTSLYNYAKLYADSAYAQKFETYKVPAVLFKSTKAKVSPDVEKIVTRVAPSIGKGFNKNLN